MLATKVQCPHCGKHLKTSKPLTAGHRVLCSRCGRSFAAPAPAAIQAANAAPPVSAVTPEPTPIPPPSPHFESAPKLPSPQPLSSASAERGLENKHVQTMPEPSKSSPPPKRQVLLIGAVLGGLLLLLVTTIGLVVYFGLHKTPQDTAVQASQSSDTDDAEHRLASESANIPNSHDGDVLLPPPPPPPGAGKSQDPPLLPDPALTANADSTEASWLPREEQEQVNKAIDHGVEWLKKRQRLNGSWGVGRAHDVGLAALPALTLLECGVKADDSRIQKAHQHVRLAIPSLQMTYDLSLAILFLDRLGDPEDEKLIQTCALRLVAGQKPSGGWTYDCPILQPKQEHDLLTVMREKRPKSSLDLFVGGPNGSAPPGFITRDPNAPLNKDIQGSPSGDSKLLPEGGVAPLDKDRPSAAEAKRAWERLPEPLRKLPSLQPPKTAHKLPSGDGTDNSNTQFAILGLLAAGHHDVPLERTYALIVHRFHASQAKDGHWNYHYSAPARGNENRPAMTGAGLLGLAVEYGLAHDQVSTPENAAQLKDPAVEKGFDFLAQSIGKPLGIKKQPRGRGKAEINLYLLWTVERCGVLFNRRQIGGKDWYRWGAELLIDSQERDGSWNKDGYYSAPNITPITDTCFALLFLKRANLAKELTKKLEFFMQGKQLQARP